MASIIASTESAISQINQWLGGLGIGENAGTIANTQTGSVSSAGNSVQLWASGADALEAISDILAGQVGLVGGSAVFLADLQDAAQQSHDNNGAISIDTAQALVGVPLGRIPTISTPAHALFDSVTPQLLTKFSAGVHQHSLYRCAQARRREHQHGRAWAGAGQHLRRASVA
jgi:hypothetical protein